MIVSLNFLSHFWKQTFSVSEITDALIKSGVEIEAYEEIITPTNLCYGIVKSVDKIQDSKKLNYCKVFIPQTNETFNIICGASNVRAELKVLVAKVNATIFNKKILIEKKTIFGHESEGMICAYAELYKSNILKIPKNLNLGIIELDADWDCSKPFSPDDLNLNDHIFELSIPIHRKDLNCVWSLAMEIQKNLGIENQDASFYKPIHNFAGWNIKSLLWNNNFFEFSSSCTQSSSDVLCTNTKDQSEPNKDIYPTEQEQYIYSAFNELINENLTYRVYQKSPYFWTELVQRYLKEHPNKTNLIKNKPTPKPFSVNWERISSLFKQDNLLKQPNLCKQDHLPKQPNIQTTVETFLKKAHFKFENNTVTPPPWRIDLTDEGTFLNEISIIFCLDDMSIEAPEILINNVQPKNTTHRQNQKITDFLNHLGFIECITPNFQKNTVASNYNIFEDKNIHKLSNPSSSKDTLRKHALFELLKIIEFNQNQKNEIFPIFELTNISNINSNYWVCNILIVNEHKSFALNKTACDNDIYDLLAIIKRLSKALKENWSFNYENMENAVLKDIESTKDDMHQSDHTDNNLFNNLETINIVKDNQAIGYVGNLQKNNSIIKGLKLGKVKNISAAVIKLDNNYKLDVNHDKSNIFKSVSLYPVSIKDISVLMPDSQLPIKTILELIKNTKYCIDCKLIEKYIKSSEEYNKEKIVYLFRVFLQSNEETLTKEQIHDSLNAIAQKMEEVGMKVQ